MTHERLCCDARCVQGRDCPLAPQRRDEIPAPTLPCFPFAPGVIDGYRPGRSARLTRALRSAWQWLRAL